MQNEPESEAQVPTPPTAVADEDARLVATQLDEVWPILTPMERLEGFRGLDHSEAETFFLGRSARAQARLLELFPEGERRLWLRLLPPDDAADVLQEIEAEQREDYLALLDERARREVKALLAYEEDEAGGLMSPRFARLRPEMPIDESISYLRRHVHAHPETIYYAYVLDPQQILLGVVSLRELLAAAPGKLVRDVMRESPVVVSEDTPQEEVARLIAKHDILAVPVVDGFGHMKGIVTVDDVIDVVQKEATEDIQRLGGMEALDRPYLQSGLGLNVRKRAGWLAVLFVGELLTANAMTHFEDDIQQLVVLAVFVPLIISSGGNSGSQASTLVIRAMALGEVKLRDWANVMRRELFVGLALGSILAVLGLVRIVVWEKFVPGTYGEHSLRFGATLAISLLFVVTWGALAGAMLPFLLRRLRFDPASSSAPFVATLVDVSGLVIYFNVAWWLLRGYGL